MKKAKAGSKKPVGNDPVGNDSAEIDTRLKAMTDWRGKTLAKVRAIIRQVDPEIVEEIKWRKPSNDMSGVPVWSLGGIICTGETYKEVVKITFAHGAALPDPSKFFNASLEGNTRRAVDLREGDTFNEKALTALVRAAIEFNAGK